MTKACCLCSDVLRNSKRLKWIGYLSTTGVYGHHEGNWVTEATPPRFPSPRALTRLTAEREWLDTGLPVHVFRLAGIYGPGRSALDTVRRGTQMQRDEILAVSSGPASSTTTTTADGVDVDDIQWVSRVHVDDICGVVLSSMERPRPGAIYNVADEMPAPRRLVLEEAATLLARGGTQVRYNDPGRNGERKRRSEMENKRVDATLIRTELGYRFIHPDFKSGLRSILNIEDGI